MSRPTRRPETPSARRSQPRRPGTGAAATPVSGGVPLRPLARESVKPVHNQAVDVVAVDVDRDPVPAAGQHPPLHGGAAEQPPLDLRGVGGVDDPVALAVADQHRGPDRDQLVAHVGEQPGELVDRAGRAPAVGPELLDALEPVEVHVAAGPVPAHHVLADGQQPGLPAAEPDRGGQAGHRDDLRVVGGEVEREAAPAGLAGDRHLVALRAQRGESLLRRGRPVLPDGPVELLRRGPMTGEQRAVAAPSGGSPAPPRGGAARARSRRNRAAAAPPCGRRRSAMARPPRGSRGSSVRAAMMPSVVGMLPCACHDRVAGERSESRRRRARSRHRDGPGGDGRDVRGGRDPGPDGSPARRAAGQGRDRRGADRHGGVDAGPRRARSRSAPPPSTPAGPAETAPAPSTSRRRRRWWWREPAARSPSTATVPPRRAAAAPTCWRPWG